MSENKPVRTRFAPSPTGFMHVGNVRAALFPWLVAQQNNGTFILRIEDTDQVREVAGAVDVIRETLGWLGMDWQEGIGVGGPHQPYVQSQRKESYMEWAHKLIEKGRAYADIRTPNELNALREDAKARHKAFLARDYRPENPVDWEPGMPLRFLSEPKAYAWHDEIMGDLSAGEEAVDDFILLKSDGFPTYNFAHIIDDHEMEITHVIRGVEYIASMPKYLNLYEALDIPKPIFAHAPHIMAPDGKKKLSKRDGAKSVLDYKEEGYLPEAMLNFLASMGWNDGTEQETFTKDELIQKFSLDRVQKSGARFDEQRLLWMNGWHIRQLPLEKLYTIVGKPPFAPGFWPPEAFTDEYDDDYRLQVLAAVQDRLKFFHELSDLTLFFFKDLPINPELISEHKQLKKIDAGELKHLLQESRKALEASDFTTTDLVARLNSLLETTGQKPAVLFSLIRIATTQAPSSPGLAETLAILGPKKSLRRIDAQITAL